MKGKKIVLKGLFVLMISFLIFGSKVNAYNISSIDEKVILVKEEEESVKDSEEDQNIENDASSSLEDEGTSLDEESPWLNIVKIALIVLIGAVAVYFINRGETDETVKAKVLGEEEEEKNQKKIPVMKILLLKRIKTEQKRFKLLLEPFS